MADDLPDYRSLKAQYDEAKRLKERDAAAVRKVPTEAEKRDKQRRVAFKASHTLLVAFLIWIM
jgi:hypothetical protein